MDDDKKDNNDFQADDTHDINPLEDMKEHDRLPQDFDTPFSPPNGVQDRLSDTDQRTDSNIDETQHYSGGIEDATGVDLPGKSADEESEEPEAIRR